MKFVALKIFLKIEFLENVSWIVKAILRKRLPLCQCWASLFIFSRSYLFKALASSKISLADTFRYEPSSVAWQSPFWTKMTLSVARHFQVQDKVSSDIVRKDVGGYQTFSSIRLKDIVLCEIFAVVRHLQLADTFSKRCTRQCLLGDICSCQTFAVVRHFQ